MSEFTFVPGSGSFKPTPLQIAMFLMAAIIVALLFGNILINSDLSRQESQREEEAVDENINEASLTIDGFRPFIPRTFKLLIEYNIGGNELALKEFSVLSEEIKYDQRLYMNSSYQVIYKNDRFATVNTFPVDVNQAVFAHPGPGESSQGINSPSSIMTYLYLPFDSKAKTVALLRDGKKLFEIPVPSYPEVESAPLVGASALNGPITVAVVSDGYTDMSAFERDADALINGMSTPPFSNVRSHFDFKLYKNTTPIGCTTNIVGCFNTASLGSVLQAAYADTGATVAIVLVRGGGISAALNATGPAIINTDTTAANIGWRGKHEFLGHVVGELHDRYYDKGGSFLSYSTLNGRATNCSDNPSGESWWGAAGGAGSYSGCAASSQFYAPFAPNCGNDGHNGTIMGLCGGQGFDTVERYWLENFIIPELEGRSTFNPGNNSGGGAVPDSPKVTLPGTCSDTAYNVNFTWTGSGTQWFVDVSEDVRFGSVFSKNVDNLTSTTSNDGFNPPLQLLPGRLYYWRVVDQAQQTVKNGNPFSMPTCAGGNQNQTPNNQTPNNQTPNNQTPNNQTPDSNYSLNSGMADNLNYFGGDLPGAGYFSPNPISCQSDCQNNTLGTFCYAWTWVKSTGGCWQKDKSHALCNYDTNTVSGAKPADDTNQCPIGPYPNNNPIPGAP